MQPIVELTSDLIRFKSMHSRPDEIQNCIAFIEAYLVRHGIGFRRLDQNGVPTLLVLRPDGTAPVLLMSHIDVVDAPDALFEPRVENGRLFGRGSIDDKYAAALSLVLLAEWIERLRAAGKSQADLPFVAQVYEQASVRYEVVCRRIPEIWQYELDGQSFDNVNHYEIMIIEDAQGKPVGYFARGPG